MSLYNINMQRRYRGGRLLRDHYRHLGVGFLLLATYNSVTLLIDLSVILLLFYTLHPHPSPSIFTPRLPPKYQYLLHQLLFFLGSALAGCYLVYITNEHGHMAIMSRAPAVGCILVWFVIELDLIWALSSLTCIGLFLWWGNYSYL